jgi:kynurenine 3-monooxygenase
LNPNLSNHRGILEFFLEHFPDFVELIGPQQLAEQFRDHPIGSLITYKTRPLAHGNVVLLGDAGHAVLPFYGQGMNAGFEDLLVLDGLLESGQPDEVFARFNNVRPDNAEAIHELALENYREMRKDVLEWRFRAQCWLGRTLNWCFPTLILPRYTMIAFTTLPYSAIKPRELKTRLICGAFVVMLGILIGVSRHVA